MYGFEEEIMRPICLISNGMRLVRTISSAWGLSLLMLGVVVVNGRAEETPATESTAEKEIAKESDSSSSGSDKTDSKPEQEEASPTEVPAAESKPAGESKPAEAIPETEAKQKPTEKEISEKKPENSEKKDAGGDKQAKKKAPAKSTGNLLQSLGGLLSGGRGVPFQAPSNPVEAIEQNFNQLKQQLNQPRYVVGPDGKAQPQEKEEKEEVGLPEKERNELIELVKEAAPQAEFEKLPKKRQQEVIQHLQNSTHYWMNQRNWGTLADENYRLAGRDVLILGLKRLMKMPVIESEDPEGVKKQIEAWGQLIQDKSPVEIQEMLKEEVIRKSFLQQAQQQMNYQFQRTDTLAFKVVVPDSELKAPLEKLDQSLKQYLQNNGGKIENVLQRYGDVGQYLTKSPEDRKKFLLTPQGMYMGQQLYYAVYPLQQFGQSLSQLSSGYAKRTKYVDLDISGGVATAEMMKANLKLQRLQQKMWNEESQAARPDIKDPAGIVKYAFEQVSRYGGNGRQVKDKLTPEQMEARKKDLQERVTRILQEELPEDVYSKLTPARQGRILQEAQNAVARALAYNSSEKLSDEERDSALLNLKLTTRESVKMPYLQAEGREITEKQIDQYLQKLIDLARKNEPELLGNETLRGMVLDNWRSELISMLEDSQTASFKTPMSPERFATFMAQAPLKFQVFAGPNPTNVNLLNNVNFDKEAFKKMSPKEQDATLEDPGTLQMASYTVTNPCSRLIQNVGREFADYAKSTRYKSVDLKGGVSDAERTEQNRLADKARQIQYDRYVASDPAMAKRELERTGHNKAFMEEEQKNCRNSGNVPSGSPEESLRSDASG